MKIVKIGTFKGGVPTGWHLDVDGSNQDGCCLFVDFPESKIYVGGDQDTGVEVVEWSKECKESKTD